MILLVSFSQLYLIKLVCFLHGLFFRGEMAQNTFVRNWHGLATSIVELMSDNDALLYSMDVDRILQSHVLLWDIDHRVARGGLRDANRLRLKTAQRALTQYIAHDLGVRWAIFQRYGLEEYY